MFEPSKYQKAFFDELIAGKGDIQLVAVAGSGKTRSIEEATQIIPRGLRQSTLLTAFNKHIQIELQSRQSSGRIPQGIEISTIHGLGYKILKDNLRPQQPNKWVDGSKYTKLVDLYWKRLNLQFDVMQSKPVQQAIEATNRLTELSMLHLDQIGLEHLAGAFGVSFPPERWSQIVKGVESARTWGLQGLEKPDSRGLTYHPKETVSFTDMVALPSVMDLRAPQYRLVFVDESQDLNHAQQELLLRVRGRSGRAVWVGDPRQAIYGFAGADARAFDQIRERTGATRLPLSICYRCPKSVVRLAQALVPEIETAATAEEGTIVQTAEGDILAKAAAHYRETATRPETFLILCRTNAPLITAAFGLLSQGIPAQVIGSDIGKAIGATIDAIAQSAPDFTFAEFPQYAAAYLGAQIQALMGRSDTEQMQSDLYDRIDSALAVYSAAVNAGRTTLRAMKEYVDTLFADKKDAIQLSSIHKAKGLEAPVVALIRCDLLPHPRAFGAQLEQEANLAYVAITRAQKTLMMDGPTGFNLPLPAPILPVEAPELQLELPELAVA